MVRIKKVSELRDLVDLLDIEKYSGTTTGNFPEDLDYKATQRGLLKHHPHYRLYGIAPDEVVENEVYVLKYATMQELNYSFEYLIFANTRDVKDKNNIPKEAIKSVRLSDIIKYERLEKF
jgi:hypothetical protein